MPTSAADPLSLALLALVQGLTEFLPVSSSGHLVLAQAWLGWREPALAVDIALHVGTLVAVVGVYRRALGELWRDLRRGRPRELALLFGASVPAGLVGVLWGDELEAFYHGLAPAGAGLCATALILALAEVRRRRGSTTRDLPGWRGALAIGCAQALAIWPGVSRSGSTIAAGLFAGLPPRAAARFSFLLSLPAIAGAAALRLPDALDEARTPRPLLLLGAAALAALVGWVALRLFLRLLASGAFLGFAVYCAGLGVLALAL